MLDLHAGTLSVHVCLAKRLVDARGAMPRRPFAGSDTRRAIYHAAPICAGTVRNSTEPIRTVIKDPARHLIRHIRRDSIARYMKKRPG